MTDLQKTSEVHPGIARCLTLIAPNIEPADYLYALERKVEEDLLQNFFPLLSIQASVKSEPYSLPYTAEISYELQQESYINGMLEFQRCYRHWAKELLNQDIHKLRFYVHIDTLPVHTKDPLFSHLGRVRYTLRYYPHKITV